MKLFVKSGLRRSPILELSARILCRRAKILFFSTRWKVGKLKNLVTGNYLKEIATDSTSWVSPQSIFYSALKEFSLNDFKGWVIAGDWDCLTKRFEDLDVYLAFTEVCKEGKAWTDTIFYQRIVSALSNGQILWGCRNRRDLDQRCKGLEALFRQIRDEGYKSQRQILQETRHYDPLQMQDEVTVSIGRDGDLLFSNSAHRLAIAKILDIEKIPIKIAVRHPNWVAFVKELYNYARDSRRAIWQPVNHPDLANVPRADYCESKYSTLLRSISASGGRLLDVRAGLGYFCHRFEDVGFHCYALESDPTAFYFLEKLKRTANKNFRAINKTVLEWPELRGKHFDVILALNSLHLFLKTAKTHQALICLLTDLQMSELFFQSVPPNQAHGQGAYKSYSAERFVEFLLTYSRLTNVEPIGSLTGAEQMYRLY